MQLRFDLIVNYSPWKTQQEINKRYIRKVLSKAMNIIALDATCVELAILLTDDDRIKELNSRYRQKDKATNVLSFPAADMPGDTDQMLYLGDIVFAYQTILNESLDDTTFLDHFTHLLVHGLLHLLGYTHDDEEQATIMEGLETKILQTLSIRDPYS